MRQTKTLSFLPMSGIFTPLLMEHWLVPLTTGVESTSGRAGMALNLLVKTFTIVSMTQIGIILPIMVKTRFLLKMLRGIKHLLRPVVMKATLYPTPQQ